MSLYPGLVKFLEMSSKAANNAKPAYTVGAVPAAIQLINTPVVPLVELPTPFLSFFEILLAQYFKYR